MGSSMSFSIKRPLHNPTAKPNTVPGGNTGLRLPAPGRRIHHLNMLERMVIAQILQRFHHQPYAPAQAGAALNSC